MDVEAKRRELEDAVTGIVREQPEYCGDGCAVCDKKAREFAKSVIHSIAPLVQFVDETATFPEEEIECVGTANCPEINALGEQNFDDEVAWNIAVNDHCGACQERKIEQLQATMKAGWHKTVPVE